MARLIAFFVVVLSLGWAFSWLADRPGDLVVTFLNTRYEVTLSTALALFLAGVAIIMVLWWLVRSIIEGPQSARRYFRARRRDRGYQALSTGMIAAGSGDGATAKKLVARASGFISADQEPLIHYLTAQVALLEGNNSEARKAFEAMLENGETKTLGLRGLFLEAQRMNDPIAARHFAEKAYEAAPTLDWASDAALSGHAQDGAWDKALSLLDNRKRIVGTDKAANDRKRAVFLTAKAMSTIEFDVTGARNAAVEANRLAPAFIPAAIIAGRALFKTDELRKGAKILEAAWKLTPHPQIADIYIHARAGDSAIDRAKRAAELLNLQPGHAAGLLALASAELAAGEYTVARGHVESVLKTNPTENAWLLLADIEQAETGHEGRVREWLQKAVKAPRDAAWMADGQISDHWMPYSPVTGRLDAFEWKVPVMLLSNPELEVDAETLTHIRELPAKLVPVADDVVSTDTKENASMIEVLDAETVVRSAGFQPAAQTNDVKKKGGFRLF